MTTNNIYDKKLRLQLIDFVVGCRCYHFRHDKQFTCTRERGLLHALVENEEKESVDLNDMRFSLTNRNQKQLLPSQVQQHTKQKNHVFSSLSFPGATQGSHLSVRLWELESFYGGLRVKGSHSRLSLSNNKYFVNQLPHMPCTYDNRLLTWGQSNRYIIKWVWEDYLMSQVDQNKCWYSSSMIPRNIWNLRVKV